MIRVTVWNEFRHEKNHADAKEMYPKGIHGAVCDFLKVNDDMKVTTATLNDEEQGLPDSLLDNTDVLVWWGHGYHDEVRDELAKKIQNRIYTGKMGLVALHSSHESKPFRLTLGTYGNLGWGREQKEIVWNVMPSHPIAKGIPEHFTLESEELYSEPFYIPQPEAVVFGSWFEDGHILRSGVCFTRGAGRVFWFQPGHETRPSFYNPYVQRIITNGIRWAAPDGLGFEVPDHGVHYTQSITDEK